MIKKIITYLLVAGIVVTIMPISEVMATEIKGNGIKIESLYREGINKEAENIQDLDDREFKISFDEFIEAKKNKGLNENIISEKVIIEDGMEIIETNLKWNGDLNYSNKPKEIVLHHIEASRPGKTIPVTDVHQWHLANGWAGIGYHFYITKTGKIYRGRPENAIGAHAKNFNIDTLGIAVEGKYGTEAMPTIQREAVEKLGGYLRGKYNINKVMGHGEKMPTSCPGKNYPLDTIRKNILAYPSYPEYEAPILDKLAIQYESFVEGEGWQQWKRDGETSGTVGKAKRIENFKMKLNNAGNSTIKYKAHVADYGWKDWSSNGDIAGVMLEGKRIEAIEMKLEGEITEKYDIEYRVHVEDEGWNAWTRSGVSGTVGKAKRIEAIEARLVEKKGVVFYNSHIQDIGWQGWNCDGDTSGTTGEEKRIESIRIKPRENSEGLSFKYRVHGEDYGWQNWVNNGELAGTVGEKKRIEAIEIKLEGEEAVNKNVEYRVHVENIGWMPWVANGEIAGTVGEAKRIEAIEIRVK